MRVSGSIPGLSSFKWHQMSVLLACSAPVGYSTCRFVVNTVSIKKYMRYAGKCRIHECVVLLGDEQRFERGVCSWVCVIHIVCDRIE